MSYAWRQGAFVGAGRDGGDSAGPDGRVSCGSSPERQPRHRDGLESAPHPLGCAGPAGRLGLSHDDAVAASTRVRREGVFTDEEAAAYQARTLEEQADYDRSPSVHAKCWLDYGKELTADKRTSLIVDPPDGRIPQLTAGARQRLASRGQRRRAHPADAAEYRSLTERCLTFGTPRLPGAYNNNYLILQTPDYVVIHSEMIHDTRVVPLNRGPSLVAAIPQLHGDARGRWDGDTLVVESTNYSPKGAFRGATARLRLVGRFTRVGPDTIHYEITADDPAT